MSHAAWSDDSQGKSLQEAGMVALSAASGTVKGWLGDLILRELVFTEANVFTVV